MNQEFQDQLKLLSELQEIDLKLHADNVALKALPFEKERVEEDHRRARAEFDALQNEFDELEKQRKTDEMDLEASIEDLKKREARLYAIKTNKEYQAAVKEITEAKRLNREREERTLKAMERIEDLTKKIEQLKSDITDKDAEFEKKVAELDGRAKELEEQIKQFESRRPELLEKMDKAILRKYDFVRSRYPDALVPVAGGVCSGCSMNIPPQLSIEVMKGLGFKNCPSCHRLIFYPNEQEKTE
jgi:predicted  nucleic acid-binding Zn-ribbon protein